MAFEATYISYGDTIDHTPAGDIAAGEVVVVSSNFVAVARHAIVAGVKGALTARGIFDFDKEAPLVISEGDAVYWDDTANEADKTATNNYIGVCVEDAASAATTVRVDLRSIEAAAVETLALEDLSDVDSASTYTAGNVLVADGDSFEEVAVSGDATLAADGTATLNASKGQQIAIIHVEDGAAGVDIANRPIFAIPPACTLVSASILTEGAPAGVDDANTSVILLEDEGSNAIVTKTYNTGTQPPSTNLESLGALDATHKILTAEEMVWLSVTNGATADLPAFSVIIVYEVTNV